MNLPWCHIFEWHVFKSSWTVPIMKNLYIDFNMFCTKTNPPFESIFFMELFESLSSMTESRERPQKRSHGKVMKVKSPGHRAKATAGLVAACRSGLCHKCQEAEVFGTRSRFSKGTPVHPENCSIKIQMQIPRVIGGLGRSHKQFQPQHTRETDALGNKQPWQRTQICLKRNQTGVHQLNYVKRLMFFLIQ